MLTFKNHEVPILHSLQLISSLEMHNVNPCNQAHQFYSRDAIKVLSAWQCPAAHASHLHPHVSPRGKRSGGNPAVGQHSGSFPCFCGLCKSKVGTQQLRKFEYSVKMIVLSPVPQPCHSEFHVLGLFHVFANFRRRSSLGPDQGLWGMALIYIFV